MAKFELGQVTATASIIGRIKTDHAFEQFVETSLERFGNCDWGNLCQEDCLMMDKAVKNNNDAIMGAYTYTDGLEIWIKTEYDHSATTILFPYEW